jgi:uncharacterized MAPEG superfamily protein
MMTIALWCVLLTALMPLVTTGIAKKLGGSYNNHDPRTRAQSYEGMAKRAYAAHQNGFEAFPLFAVAVLVAELKGGPRFTVDMLAMAHVGFRIAYTAAYIYDRPTLRSALWILALATTIGIFTSPLWR